MPTPYNDATEMMVLQEFQKRVDQEEGVVSFDKSESPDGIIHTSDGKIIGIEVTSAIRTDESAKFPKDKNRVAIFFNKHGLYDPKLPRSITLTERFAGGVYERALISKITERIQEKEANQEYSEFKTRFNKSVLGIYLDEPLISTEELELVISQGTYSRLLNVFNEVYLYIRPSCHTSPSGIKHIGGFYLVGSRTRE